MKTKLKILKKGSSWLLLLLLFCCSHLQAQGNALNFDGSNDYVNVNNTIGNFGTANFTVETWVRTQATSAIIIAKRNAISYGNFFQVGTTGGKLFMEVNASSSADYTIITSDKTINDNRWHHVAAMRSSGQLILYVDGQLATTAPVTINGTPNISNSVTTTIGAWVGINQFNGSLDEMRIWNTARTSSQIQSNMLGTVSASSTGLLAYYNFDGASGTALTDRTTNSNNGTLTNFALSGTSSNWVESYAMVVPTASAATGVSSAAFTANWTAPTVGTVTNYFLDVSTSSTFASAITGSPFTVATGTTSKTIVGLIPATTYYYRVRADKTSVTAQGGYSSTITTATTATMVPPGNALNFSTTSSISFTNPFSNATDNFTLETWMNWNGNTTTQNSGYCIVLINGNAVSPFSGYGFQLNTSNGKIGYFMSGIDGRECSAITPGKWYHLALVRKNGVATLFVNGVPDPNTTSTSPNAQATSAKIGLYGFAGNIDEVRMWNEAKTQAQIQAAMFTLLQGTEANLRSYYNFDDGIAGGTNTGITNLADRTSNGNSGTLTNFALSSITSNWVESYAMVVPTAGEATAVNSSSFTVNWTAPAVGTVTNYLLDVSTSSTFASAITGSPFTVATGTTSRVITGLNPSTTYYYRVRADKTSVTGQGGYSSTITVCTSGTVTAASSSPSLCINSALTAITHTTVGATGIGTASNLPAGVIASWTNNTITISGTPSVSGTFNYSIPLTVVCGSAVNATGTIVVNSKITPTFTQVNAICSGATLSALPTTSNNAITGTWSPALNNTATTTYTFTPTAGLCANTNAMTITVNTRVTPSFTAVAPICSGATLSALPTTSTNAISGTWLPALNNTATTPYTFTPTAGLCANTTVMTITVNPRVTPSFTAVAPICSGATLLALPTTSTNAISGTWLPVVNDTATTLYMFTPTAGLCANTTTMTITVNPTVTPQFNQIDPICGSDFNEGLNQLPNTSLNGIVGIWRLTELFSNYPYSTYEFLPNEGQCATTVQMEINVQIRQNLSFNMDPVCAGSDIMLPPYVGDFSGTWYPAFVSEYAGTRDYFFRPESGSCANGFYMSITVIALAVPTFNEIAPICSGTTLSALPTTSKEGIVGVWSPPLNNLATTMYTFTPNVGQCATTAIMTITVNPATLTPTFTQVPTICYGASVAELPTTSLDGIAGTWSPALNNLETTTYTFTRADGLCGTASMKVIVNAPVTPEFNQIESVCASDYNEVLNQLPTTSLNGIVGTWQQTNNWNYWDYYNSNNAVFFFTPSAGQCATTAQMNIDVQIKRNPYFNINSEFCQYSTFTLPNTSLDGIQGTWSPVFDSNYVGTRNYTFTPYSNSCANVTTISITVNPLMFVESWWNVLPNGYCYGESVYLPTTSPEGITGTWSPTSTTERVDWYTFTPNAGQKCVLTEPITFYLPPTFSPFINFNQIAPICQGGTLVLPNVSEGGWYRGSWSPAVNNTETTTYTFTADNGPPCDSNFFQMTVEIYPATTPTFNEVAPIGIGSSLAPLPTTSNEGIAGVWSPSINNLTTTTYTFTPNAGQCASTATMIITVDPTVTPTFNQASVICSGDSLSALPTSSIEGISGTWSPALNNLATTTYTFTPNAGQSATTTKMIITVTPSVTPIFNQVPVICYGESLSSLPTTSNEGIVGVWSPAINNLATTTYTFTPNAGQCATTAVMTITVYHTEKPVTANGTFCISQAATLPSLYYIGTDVKWYSTPTGGTALSAETVLVSGNYYASQTLNGCESDRSMAKITILPAVVPAFTQVPSICAGANLAALPLTSLDGYAGTWSPAINNLATTTYTFTPNWYYCASPATMTIVVRGAGTIAGGNVTVCTPGTALNSNGVSTVFSNSTTLNLIGNSAGSTILWQRSTNFVNATNATPIWSTVANTTTTTNNVQIIGNTLKVSNLTITTWYRAKATNGTCITYTDPVKITLSPLAKAGVITSLSSVCAGGSISFTSAAYTGSAIAWEVSTTSATAGFSTVAGENGLTFNMNSAPSVKFYVRSVITSGACSIARSAVKTITVSPPSVGGIVAGGGAVCSGSNKVLKIAGYTGTIQWMYATNGTNFMNVPTGSGVAPTFVTTSTTGTGSTYVVNNITGTAYFKAVVKSGACSTSESNVVVFNTATTASQVDLSIESNQLCSGSATSLYLPLFVGDVKIQKSINWTSARPTWTTVTLKMTQTLYNGQYGAFSTGALTQTTAYRAISSIGSCAPVVYGSIAVIGVYACTTTREIETPAAITTPFEVIAYPNPSTNVFNFKVNGADDETVSILVFDMMGRQVDNKVVKSTEIETISLGQNYASGVYNVIVSQGMNTKTVRLVKN